MGGMLVICRHCVLVAFYSAASASAEGLRHFGEKGHDRACCMCARVPVSGGERFV